MLERIREHRLVAVTAGASVLLVIAGWLWTYFALRTVAAPLILRFDRDRGITHTGSLAELSLSVAFGLGIILVDAFLAVELDGRDWFWGKFLAFMAAAFATLIFLTLAAIITTN